MLRKCFPMFNNLQPSNPAKCTNYVSMHKICPSTPFGMYTGNELLRTASPSLRSHSSVSLLGMRFKKRLRKLRFDGIV